MRKNLIINILLVVFILIFLISGFFLVRYFLNSRKQQDTFDDLAHLVENAQTEPVPTKAPENPTGTPEETEPADPLVTVTNPETGAQVRVLPEYADLYLMNPDMVGWMKLPDTKINYPVMQTPDRPDFYLHKDFNREYSSHGCFYVREICDVFAPSDNLTIYGHFMRDGSMMAALHRYTKKSFWETHPVIFFDTLQEHHEYEIFSVFVTTATQGQGFAYHTFVDAQNEAQFDQFVYRCRDLSFYDTGITPEYGDKLITLSTCDYTVQNGRLVVVARRK